MGTLFFTTEMHLDGAYGATDKRQVEVFRPSGEWWLCLRIGELNERDGGRGAAVQLDEAGAREVLQGLLAGMRYLGFNTDEAPPPG